MSQLSVCLLDWPLLNVTAMYHHYSSFNHHVNFTIMVWCQAKAVAPGERIPVPWLPLARPGRPWLWCKVSHFTLSLSHLIKCQTVVFWLLNSDSIKCHPDLQSDILFSISWCFEYWRSGQWWCWWGSTAQARPLSSGTCWNRWEAALQH